MDKKLHFASKNELSYYFNQLCYWCNVNHRVTYAMLHLILVEGLLLDSCPAVPVLVNG